MSDIRSVQSPERPSAPSRQSDAQPGAGGAHGLTIEIPVDSASDAASEPEPAPVSGLQRQVTRNSCFLKNLLGMELLAKLLQCNSDLASHLANGLMRVNHCLDAAVPVGHPAPQHVQSSSCSAPSFEQGSMNLPPPEECGAPAEHPEMCILRIRRQHLIEVCLSVISQLAVAVPESQDISCLLCDTRLISAS